jgi:adenosylcobinamide-GDP ribazoletransferase
MRTRTAAVIGCTHSFVAALQLLTRFPVPIQVPFEEKVLRRSVIFFPVAGLLIGLFLYVSGSALTALLPAGAAAALLTAIWVGITGGLHLDGLMDTADGVLSHRSRERMLEIMKDSRVGAMGVMACVVQLLLKFAFLNAIMEAGWGTGASLVLGTAIWSRWVMVAAIAIWPYARSGEGMGSMFKGVGGRQLMGCSAAAAIVSVAALSVLSGGRISHVIMLSSAAILLAGAFGGLVAWRLAGKLGGLTGDTYGAINELTEAWLLFAAVLYMVHVV